MRKSFDLPLFWRVIAINGAVFVVGTAALALSPATVSTRVVFSEAIVLAVGLTVMLVTNGLLLHNRLAPLDRLSRQMSSVDLLRPGQRVSPADAGSGGVAALVASYNAMLDRLEAERSASAAAALAATEAERARIARELHDEIGQSLTVVLLGLKRVADQAPPQLSEELELIQDSARASLDEVRRVARRLRPGVLDDLGLLSALAALASEFTENTGLPVRRGFAPGLPALDPQAELVVYRVAQEGLTNAARHSGASRVELSLSRQGDAVVLRVADDGHGLRGAEDGAGIRGMRERALLVGADLRVGSRSGGGTEVRMVVPVRPRAEVG
ncbi:sensor histidine kinase [Sporichthya brevicatena]|uniref:histidine kinase n=1 Tax=Sporichthya brevicatena TaxID=171442 RepID=A0ABN1GEF4_9ACTN